VNPNFNILLLLSLLGNGEKGLNERLLPFLLLSSFCGGSPVAATPTPSPTPPSTAYCPPMSQCDAMWMLMALSGGQGLFFRRDSDRDRPSGGTRK
jgi:hypothetical protein